MTEKINQIRKEIDALDLQLVDLLVRRFKLATEIGDYKRHNGLAIIDEAREATLLDNVTQRAGSAYQQPITAVYQTILTESKQIQYNDKTL